MKVNKIKVEEWSGPAARLRLGKIRKFQKKNLSLKFVLTQKLDEWVKMSEKEKLSLLVGKLDLDWRSNPCRKRKINYGNYGATMETYGNEMNSKLKERIEIEIYI